jgi:uncharacterized membrane protein YkoI
MNRKLALVAVLVVAVLTGGIAIAAGGGDDDEPLTGTTRDRAVEAALEHTGGTVLETEAGDDGAAYGVEIRLADGRTVEVELDETFDVIGQETDDDTPDEEED